jgi:hypothetical protein
MENNDIEKLTEYADLDGTEVGSYVNALLELRVYSEPHGMSEKFSKELEVEMAAWLTRFKEETTIISEEVDVPARTVIQKTLEWL